MASKVFLAALMLAPSVLGLAMPAVDNDVAALYDRDVANVRSLVARSH